MFECVSELLRHGSDVNHLNSMGLTPLHLALQNTDRFRKDSVCLKFVRELVTKGYNADVNIGDKTGKFLNFLSPAHDLGQRILSSAYIWPSVRVSLPDDISTTLCQIGLKFQMHIPLGV